MNVKNLEADSSKSSPPIFILCDTCHWAATYFDKNRLPNENACLYNGQIYSSTNPTEGPDH